MTESRFHRWSKRKAETHQEQEEKELQKSVSPEDPEEPEISTEEQVSEETKEIELPPLESLGPESDYSAFLSPEVDEQLKKLALRKLFKAPFYNVLDGLNDYDDDFTSFEALGDIVTSDMKFHQERKKAEQEQIEREKLEKQAEEQESIETMASEETEPVESDSDEETDQTELVANELDQDEDNSIA